METETCPQHKRYHPRLELNLPKEPELKRVFVTSFTLLALLGCSTTPVRVVDYEDQPIRRFTGHSISLEEVQIDIRMAASRTGWNIVRELPGHFTATRLDRKASATVEIRFNLDKYSITYKNSDSLDYTYGCTNKTPDGPVKVEGKCINPAYNEWVTTLNNEIAQKMQY